MDIQAKLKQFFELAGDKPTADTINDAVKAIGYTPELKPAIIAYAEHHNIDIQKDLNELSGIHEKANSEKKIKETAASIAEKAGALIVEKQKELIKNTSNLAASFTAAKQGAKKSRFYTADDYLNECQNYDPSKDFTPSMLAGLRFANGTLSYIGARPSGGKSTLLVNLAREALASNRNVFLANLEMIDRTVITNYILSLMYATASDCQRNELKLIENPICEYYSLFNREHDNRKAFELLSRKSIQGSTELLRKNLFLYNGVGVRLETLIADIENTANTGDVVLIDYLQRILPPKGSKDSRYIQIKQISNALHALATTRNLVIISGAQLGRQTKENKNNEAALEDFREGGDIEQDAHNALAIETITDNKGNDTGRYINVLKQREGGAKFKRALLDCNFNYLYMAGTGESYTPENKSGNRQNNKPPKPKQPTENTPKCKSKRKTPDEARAAGETAL
jgi:replicative DNA helicase